MTDTEAMHEALALAREAADEGEVPVGCIVTDGERIVGRGRNRETGKKRAGPRGAGGHCRGLPHARRLAAVALHALCHARTLPHVRRSHHQRPHPRVVFGAPDPKAGSCGSVTDLFALPYNHRPACEGGVLEEECAQLLRDFFRALRLAPPKPRWKPAVLPAQGGDHA